MRCFIAIPVPVPASARLMAIQAGLPLGAPVPEENLHLTLAFLGDMSLPALEAVDDELSTLRSEAFDLEIAGLGTYGGAIPAVVYAGVRPCAGLTGLRQRIRSRLHGAGIMLPRERFHPHVTLARLRGTPSADEMQRLARWLAAGAAFESPAFRVGEFALFRSTLGSGPARYDLLARYPLG